MPHPQLTETARLILRPLIIADAKALYEYRNQPDVSIFQGWTPSNPQEVADYAREMRTREVGQAGFWYQVALQLKAPQQAELSVIGDVAFCIETEQQKQAEIGIAINTQFHHQGYAQEAIKGLLNYLFKEFQLHRIHVSIDPRNTASIKLFSTVGFRHEGHFKQSVWFKGEWCDDIVMAILGSDWR